jgi:hypothetical protein
VHLAQFNYSFPTIWQRATLLPNVTAEQVLWAKIQDSVPNIPPKGQLNGSTIESVSPTILQILQMIHVTVSRVYVLTSLLFRETFDDRTLGSVLHVVGVFRDINEQREV